jgi:hypothetical protein
MQVAATVGLRVRRVDEPRTATGLTGTVRPIAPDLNVRGGGQQPQNKTIFAFCAILRVVGYISGISVMPKTAQVSIFVDFFFNSLTS